VTPEGHVVALGHTRLTVIDLTVAGAQPMTRAASTVTYNGEIYNYRALRAQFIGEGARLTSNSDTEVLLASYARWGSLAVEHLDGMFAFALWDRQRQQLVLARDRFGIKPLYYYLSAECLIFSSEVRALLASNLVPRKLQPYGLWHYLGYQTSPTPATLVDGVRMLEPGTVVESDGRGRWNQRKYWDLLDASTRTSRASSPGEARKRVGELLDDAVASHLVSDVPVGMFLSAGIDSGSILSTLATRGVRSQTFTVALQDRALDESALAGVVAHEFGSDHTQIQLRESEVLDLLPAFMDATDHPSGDGFNTFVVSKAVRDRGIKVALSGLGGDEIFGGYPSFDRLTRLSRGGRSLGRSPRALRAAAASLVRAAGAGSVAASKAAAVVETNGSIAEMWPITRQLFSAEARRALLEPSGIPYGGGEAYAQMLGAALAQHQSLEPWAAVSYAETRAYMHDVLLRDTDQTSMAHALEVRVPLLDHRLAAYVVAQPDDWKRDGQGAKPLLSGSLRRPLPLEIQRKTKQGFVLPFDAWMRGTLKNYCAEQLGERGLDGRGLLKSGEGARLWRRFLDGAPGITWSRVWSLVALNTWLERHAL